MPRGDDFMGMALELVLRRWRGLGLGARGNRRGFSTVSVVYAWPCMVFYAFARLKAGKEADELKTGSKMV